MLKEDIISSSIQSTRPSAQTDMPRRNTAAASRPKTKHHWKTRDPSNPLFIEIAVINSKHRYLCPALRVSPSGQDRPERRKTQANHRSNCGGLREDITRRRNQEGRQPLPQNQRARARLAPFTTFAARRLLKHVSHFPSPTKRPSCAFLESQSHLPVKLAVVDHRQAPKRLDCLHGPACQEPQQ